MPALKQALLTFGSFCVLLSPVTVFAVEFSTSGFVRQEIASRTSNIDNPFNQQGNLYNNRTVGRDSSVLGGGADTATRIDPTGGKDYNFNVFTTRAELDAEANFNDDLKAILKLRGIYNSDTVNESFRDTDVFHSSAHSGQATFLEANGDDWMIDFPALYLDYNKGPLWLRAGNQQIAWGEALFFRVIDVPNGLDLRRHLFLDYAAEEYADERVASPAIRGSYRLNDIWELEGFTQMSNPSALANANTPFNTIPDQFVVHHGDTKDSLNVGGRLKGQIGDLGLQFMAISRRNPDGVFRWTESGVNRDLPGAPGSGAVLAQTPFEVSPLGVWSAEEWFDYAAQVRLDGHAGLNSAIRDFPAAALLGAAEVPTKELAEQELDLFFQLSGSGLRGHLERIYPREEIFGLAMNYVFFSEPDTLLDQLITRFEVTYTPDKQFTHPSLQQKFIEEDEWAASLVFEKFHRFSQNFPATFMSLQWLHKSQSDMFGRHLSGNGGSKYKLPDGDSSFNALSFALQQAFPNLTWRADLAVLYDVKGGIMVQPGFRYKPSSAFTVEAFANFIEGSNNDDVMSSLDWADEVAVRLSYQF